MHVNICTATINQTPLDWVGNRQRILKVIAKAKQQGAQVVLFPELCVSGYGCEDWFFSDDVIEKSWESLRDIQKYCDNIVVILGLACGLNDKVFNGAAVIQNKKILGINAKKALANQGVYYEQRWFTPWTTKTTAEYRDVPFGDLVYRFGDFDLGLEICEEAWVEPYFPQKAPVHLVCNPSASHFEIEKDQRRENVMRRQSRAHQCHYAYTNLVGLESGRLIYDGSMMIIDQDGEVCRQHQRFSMRDHNLLLKSLKYEPHTNDASSYIQADSLTSHERISAPPEPKTYSPFEEFLYAEALGLFDYLRKSASKGFVISLSGGRDSSCIALLTAHMLTLAKQELGEDVTRGELSLPFSFDEQKVITCLYQATEHSSDATRTAARELCRELNLNFLEVDIQPAIDLYLRQAQDLAHTELSWTHRHHDLAWQNIQARSRVQLPWMLANLENKLLLATTNRSEAAVGYTTMDGDSAGGLAPLGGVHKAFLNEWLAWAQNQTSVGLGPVGSLKGVLAVEATAELKPAQYQQTDEKDLMPFPLLNRIEELFVLKKMSNEEIFATIEPEFSEYSAAQKKAFIEKFSRLWRMSQWKRERFAPSFHIFSYSLDPKTWCRYPILSG